MFTTPQDSEQRRSIFRKFCLAVGLAGTISFAVATQPANAMISGCRSDPVLLVNGALADVFATLQTDASSVQELDYTVTVPSGSLIGKTTLTVGIGFPEKVAYVFSPTQRWGTIHIDATVVGTPGVAPFPVSIRATTLLSSSSAAGMSGTQVSLDVASLIML